MHDMLKRKICKEKSKAKRSQFLLNMIASVYSRRCWSYRIYLEGDSPHQAVMIVCELSDFLISQIVIACIHLCNLTMFFTHNKEIFFAILDTCAETM